MTDNKQSLMASLTGEGGAETGQDLFNLDTTDNKQSLMASLTGEGGAETGQDLFGKIPVNTAPPPVTASQLAPVAGLSQQGQLIVDNPHDLQSKNPLSLNATTQASEAAQSVAETRKVTSLAASGLLGSAIFSNVGGLFDEVDKEEEERARRESEIKRRELEERKRLAEEQLRRQQEEEQRRRQAEEQMMQTVSLANSVAYSSQQQPLYASHQQQGMMNPMQQQGMMNPMQQQGTMNSMQQQGMMNPMQQQGMMNTMPQQGMMNTMQQRGMANTMQQQGMTNTMQQQGMMNTTQQQGMMNTTQQQGMMNTMTNQMNNMSMSTPNMSMSTPNPGSFAERSQMMQQQVAASQFLPQTTAPGPPMQQQNSGHAGFSPGFYRPNPNVVDPRQHSMPSLQVQQNPNFSSPQRQHNASTGRLSYTPTPSLTAGMHNTRSNSIRRPPVVVEPTPFEAIYGQVTVAEPLLVQPPSLFNVVPPYWTYQVQTALKEGGCWLVRRRFRHIVALEERLRIECIGAILSPRPDKHATRAIEEASTLQSAEFATQRAAEIQVYLNALVCHPHAGKSSALKLFLALQDDMGTAWPEVSSNALTRFGAVSGAAVQNVTDSQMPWDQNTQDALEDDAELLALASSEGIRMGAVVQAVPKLEGSITLMREHGECAGAVGMEMGKLNKAVEAADRDLGIPIDVLSQGLLRYGRRQRRLALELSAAMNPFLSQYKLCKYEKMAFHDRRTSLQKRVKERGRADFRAQKLMINQRTLHGQGQMGELDRLEREASYSDEVAVGAVHQSDFISAIVKSEVNRVAFERRTEWSKSMKVLCSSLREATAEHASIWESTRDSFLTAFPEYNVSVSTEKSA